jgi:hypothetical protein
MRHWKVKQSWECYLLHRTLLTNANGGLSLNLTMKNNLELLLVEANQNVVEHNRPHAIMKHVKPLHHSLHIYFNICALKLLLATPQ